MLRHLLAALAALVRVAVAAAVGVAVEAREEAFMGAAVCVAAGFTVAAACMPGEYMGAVDAVTTLQDARIQAT
jgi:hypothetical protein